MKKLTPKIFPPLIIDAWYRLETAAVCLGVAPRTLRAKMREEHIADRDFGTSALGHWLIHGSELDALIRRVGQKRPTYDFRGNLAGADPGPNEDFFNPLPAAETPPPAADPVKRGRGRPRKAAPASGAA
jgi:hypothetical protein